jgi:hypothetical protein
MKRILFLLCAFLVLVDLADDGFLGKAPVLAPHCPGKIAFSSSSSGAGTVSLQVWISLENDTSNLTLWHHQIVSLEPDGALLCVRSHLFSSSGGLPL